MYYQSKDMQKYNTSRKFEYVERQLGENATKRKI